MGLLKNNPTTFWVLISSVFIVIIIGFSIWLILFLKAKKIKKSINAEIFENTNTKTSPENILKPGDNELIWDMRDKFKNTIDDVSMEYLITNVLRNAYKTIWIEGNTNGYECLTLLKKTEAIISLNEGSIEDLVFFNKMADEFKINTNKMKFIEKTESKQKFDFIFLSQTIEDFNKSFDKVWSKLNKGGMVLITGCLKLNSSQKDLIKYLKLIGARFEHQKIHKGFIIVVK